jgi:hypothetical protein
VEVVELVEEHMMELEVEEELEVILLLFLVEQH